MTDNFETLQTTYYDHLKTVDDLLDRELLSYNVVVNALTPDELLSLLAHKLGFEDDMLAVVQVYEEHERLFTRDDDPIAPVITYGVAE